MLLVDHPAVGAVLLEKPVLDRVAAFLVKLGGLGLHGGELVGVHAAPPEIRVLEVFLRLVTQPVGDVLADEGRREISCRLVAVDYCRRARQQVHETLLRGDQGFAELLARSDVAPRADHLDRIARRIAKHLQLVANPAIAAVPLAEPVLVAEALLLEQTRIGPEDARTVRGMDAALPEVRTVEVFLTVIPEQVLHVPAYERWRVVAGGLEAVDHRRRAGDQVLSAIPGRCCCFFRSLTLGDVAPRADHLDRLAFLVPDEPLFIVHPAVGAVLLEKSVLDRVGTFLEQVDRLGLHRGEVVGMHAAPPEIGVLQILLRLIAQPVLDVLADEGRREIPRRLVAVDHRRRRRQQASDPVLRGDQGFADLLARRDVVPRAHHLDRIACRVAQQLQLVADPTVAAILLAESVLGAEAPLGK